MLFILRPVPFHSIKPVKLGVISKSRRVTTGGGGGGGDEATAPPAAMSSELSLFDSASSVAPLVHDSFATSPSPQRS